MGKRFEHQDLEPFIIVVREEDGVEHRDSKRDRSTLLRSSVAARSCLTSPITRQPRSIHKRTCRVGGHSPRDMAATVASVHSVAAV